MRALVDDELNHKGGESEVFICGWPQIKGNVYGLLNQKTGAILISLLRKNACIKEQTLNYKIWKKVLFVVKMWFTDTKYIINYQLLKYLESC